MTPPPAAPRRTLMIFGDSNTHGTMPLETLGTSGRYGPQERWTGRLAALLPDWEVIAEGHPGRTTLHDDPVEGAHRNGLALLPALLESHRPLDLVILKLGTNDLKPRFAVGAADIAQSVERLVRAVRASGCGPAGGAPEVLVICPPPILEAGCLADMFAGGAAKSAGLAAQMAQAAARAGVAMLDAGKVIAVSPVDGIHYGAEANAPLAAAVADAVRGLFA
jgi:lysophospholipase L1-like esterase